MTYIDIFPLDGSDIAGLIASATAIAAVVVSLWINHDAKKPEVIVYLKSDTDHLDVGFVVENIGKGTARNVRIEGFDESMVEPVMRRVVLGGFIEHGIPTLVPGDKRSTVVCTTKYASDNLADFESEVRVRYSEKGICGGWKESGGGSFVLDYRSFSNTLFTTSDLHMIARAQKKMAGIE